MKLEYLTYITMYVISARTPSHFHVSSELTSNIPAADNKDANYSRYTCNPI